MSFTRGWIAAIVAPVAVVAGAVAIPTFANAASPPPAKSAAQVLALIAGSHHAHYSGTVQQTSDLGLPQLPSSMSPDRSGSGFDAASLLQLVTGSHTAKVYVDGRSRQRVQLLDTLSERDFIHDGASLWTYDASARTATHVTVARSEAKGRMPHDVTPVTPVTAAEKLLTAIGPTTSVTVSTGTDLGRGVYELRIAPRTTATLIGDAVVTVDAQTGVPLAVRVDARHQSTPALSVAFTSFDTSRPAASVFAFTPPPGTTVKHLTLPGHLLKHLSVPGAHLPKHMSAHRHLPAHAAAHLPKPTVIGTGWTSVVEVPAGRALSGATTRLGSSGSALLDELTQRVSGGRILQTSLFTVYLRDDGTVFAGAVPAATLLAAAK